MYTAKIENKNGEIFVLTGKEARYQILNIVGLNPPPAQINTASIVGLDGAEFNSSRLETRNIVLTVKINGNAEANRLNLYNYFRTKEWCTFYYSNDALNVSIQGYVETVECDYFAKSEQAQISIICPQPYFKSISQIITDISSTQAMFVFPFAINLQEPIPFSEYNPSRVTNVYNASESETGCLIKIIAKDAFNKIVIQNVDTGEKFTLNGDFVEDDVITINTYKAQKSVIKTVNGVTTNIFNLMEKGSVFFQLEAGNNFFAYIIDDGADSDKVFVKFYRHNVYRGV